MEDRVRTMSCNLSNRYLRTAFNELRSTIADHQAPSWVQLYFLVELCRKTIEELKINPPIVKTITVVPLSTQPDQKTF